MDRARFHEGIRRMHFTDILARSERSELSQIEAAAALLGINERTFRRSSVTATATPGRQVSTTGAVAAPRGLRKCIT
jgi:hypothetical protein